MTVDLVRHTLPWLFLNPHTLAPHLPQGQHPEYPGQDSVDALGTVERYFCELVSVPRPEERLSVMIYMRTLAPGVQQVRDRPAGRTRGERALPRLGLARPPSRLIRGSLLATHPPT